MGVTDEEAMVSEMEIEVVEDLEVVTETVVTEDVEDSEAVIAKEVSVVVIAKEAEVATVVAATEMDINQELKMLTTSKSHETKCEPYKLALN